MPGKAKPRNVLVECDHCEALVAAEERGSYSYLPDFEDLPRRATLAACPKCGGAILTLEEYYGEQNGHEFWSDPWRVCPSRGKSGQPVPRRLRDALTKRTERRRGGGGVRTARSDRRRDPTSDRVAPRAVAMPGPTNYREPSTILGGSPQGTVDDLLAQRAHALRIAGNAAAHGVNFSVSREGPEDALDFTEAIIDYLFVHRERFEEFMARRQAREDDAEHD